MNLAVNTVGTTEINAHGDNVNLSISVESSCQWSENPAPLGAGSSIYKPATGLYKDTVWSFPYRPDTYRWEVCLWTL